MDIIYKTTIKKDGNLNLYKVERLIRFNSDGYLQVQPYYGTFDKSKQWEYNSTRETDAFRFFHGYGIKKFVKRKDGCIIEEVVIRRKLPTKISLEEARLTYHLDKFGIIQARDNRPFCNRL